jgi:hypothetical protein
MAAERNFFGQRPRFVAARLIRVGCIVSADEKGEGMRM